MYIVLFSLYLSFALFSSVLIRFAERWFELAQTRKAYCFLENLWLAYSSSLSISLAVLRCVFKRRTKIIIFMLFLRYFIIFNMMQLKHVAIALHISLSLSFSLIYGNSIPFTLRKRNISCSHIMFSPSQSERADSSSFQVTSVYQKNIGVSIILPLVFGCFM